MTERRRRPTSPLWRATDEALDYLDGKKTNDEGKKVNDPNGYDLRALRVRAEEAAYRHEAGRPIHDGSPGNVGADSGSRGTSELTPTEAAAGARIETRQRGRLHDPVNDHAHRGLNAIIDAAHELKLAFAAFAAIARLTDEAPSDAPACESCLAAGLPNPRPWKHYGHLGGKLDAAAHLCDECRKYVYDNGQLPTEEQVRHHDATGRWRVRVNA